MLEVDRQPPTLADISSVLRGHNLACWCALDGGPCHADTLLRLANGVSVGEVMRAAWLFVRIVGRRWDVVWVGPQLAWDIARTVHPPRPDADG